MAKALKSVLFVGPAGDNRGPAAAAAFTAAAKRVGLGFTGQAVPTDVVTADAAAAAVRVVAVDEVLAAKLCKRIPNVEAMPPGEDAAAQANGVIARLLGGKAEGPPDPPPKPPKLPTVKVGRETAGRRGKGVTVVWEIPLGEDAMKELAAKLKERCGTGGTVKDGRIEIQGDHRDRLVTELEKLGYKAKRSGG